MKKNLAKLAKFAFRGINSVLIGMALIVLSLPIKSYAVDMDKEHAPRVISRAIYAVREAMHAKTVEIEPFHWYMSLFYLDIAQQEFEEHDLNAAIKFAEISEDHAFAALHRKKGDKFYEVRRARYGK